MTARRKLLIAVVGIGAMALIADRVLPRSENTAEAAEPSAVVAQPSKAAAISAQLAASTTIEPPLSDRIRKATEEAPQQLASRDVFRIPVAWAGIERRAEVAIAPPPSVPRFEQTHRLNGLVLADGDSRALVDGTMLSVGQSIDGHRLVGVTKNLAVFESDGSRVILHVENNPIASSPTDK
jgi:hypothetical protein